MTRRDILTAAGSAALFTQIAGTASAEPVPNPKGPLGMGGAPTSFSARRSANAPAGGRGRGGAPQVSGLLGPVRLIAY